MSQTALLALLTAVAGTIGYHLAQRQIAPDASPALVLAVAYLVGAAICGALLATVFPMRTSLRAQLRSKSAFCGCIAAARRSPPGR